MTNFLLESGTIDLIKNLAKKYSEKENIREVIKRSKSNLFQLDFSQNDEIYSQVEVLFSDENLMMLAKESDNITGYDLVVWIEEKLRSYFNKYEVEEADREEFIRMFIGDFKENLKMIMPDKYMECFLAESRKETNEKLDKLITRVYEQRNNVNNCKSFGKTIAYIENRLVKASKYNIDLNFFDYGEKEVDNKILEAVNHNRIVYVKGRSREEALYYMLRVLKENGIYNVFVVDNEDDWKQVDSVHQDSILIPFFYSRNIMPAERNNTIFVLGEEDFEGKHKVIRIPNKLYAFEKGDIQSIHPEKFENNYDFYKLQAYKNNEQQKILRENFIRTSISLNNLLEKCADVYETGSNIAACTIEMDYCLLDVMYSNKKYNVLQGYINKMFSSKGEMLFKHFFMDVLSRSEDPVFRGLILLAMELNENIVDLAGMDDALEKYYWENNYSYIKFENAIFAEQCMIKALQYNNFGLAFFWARINEYSMHVYLNLLMKYLLESDNKLSNRVEAYDIKNIFKKIYAYDDMDDETREIIILLEKSYIKVFGSEMKPKFLYKKLVEDPEFTAELLATIYREEGVLSKENISDIDRNIANVNYSVLTYVKFCPACYDEKIDERELDLWCERFLGFMANNNRERIAFNFLGKLFANSPKKENDIWPLPPICTAIEKYYNAGLEDGFVMQVHNNRGVHWCNHGVGEKELYHHYSCYADLIQLDFPKTAKMLRRIGKDYLKESVCEREKATYEY